MKQKDELFDCTFNSYVMCLSFFRLKGIISIVGAVAVDMGVVTTPQLHWMVRATNKGEKASEQDYFDQLISSFR